MIYDRVFLDMDEVLTGFTDHMFDKVYGVKSYFGQPPSHQVTHWNGLSTAARYVVEQEVSERELWESVAALGVDFWATMPWTPWGESLFDTVHKSAGDRLYILTSQARDPACSAGKVAWVQNNLPESMHRKIVLTKHKHLLSRPGSLLIDDADHNVEAWTRHGGTAVLWGAPWNKSGPTCAKVNTRRVEDSLAEHPAFSPPS